ncbi:hypothetical protein BC830DRAFT_282816 [Chytriomyces sp. MP71]|nr:hypothetical protein BC830DRAFT_282816 [Chytriomyces sp. MP71]
MSNSQLGDFAEVWGKVLVGTAEEAQFHHRFALDLSEKVAMPLTNKLDNDSEWKKQRNYEFELNKLLRVFESEEKRLKKDSGLSGKGVGLFKNLRAKKADGTFLPYQ